MINPMDLTGKHVVITGASAGIGRATAIQASKLGARISLIARNEERLKETLDMLDGEGHRYFAFDLNNVDGIESLVKNVVLQGGALDGFVHCAGIGPNRPIKLTKPSFVEEVLYSVPDAALFLSIINYFFLEYSKYLVSAMQP